LLSSEVGGWAPRGGGVRAHRGACLPIAITVDGGGRTGALRLLAVLQELQQLFPPLAPHNLAQCVCTLGERTAAVCSTACVVTMVNRLHLSQDNPLRHRVGEIWGGGGLDTGPVPFVTGPLEPASKAGSQGGKILGDGICEFWNREFGTAVACNMHTKICCLGRIDTTSNILDLFSRQTPGSLFLAC